VGCNLHQSVWDSYVGENGGEPVDVAVVGKVGGGEARVGTVVGDVTGADVEGKLDLAAEVEAFADFVLQVSGRKSGSAGNEWWQRWRYGAEAAVGVEGGSGGCR
jgi:hypothetical protein